MTHPSPTEAALEPLDEKALEAAIAAIRAYLAARTQEPPSNGAGEAHPDDLAVDRFAEVMKAKLKWEREQRNRAGWQDMSAEALSVLLYEHLPKGDPVDVANLAMMLHQNGQRLATPAPREAGEAPKAEGAEPTAKMMLVRAHKHTCANVQPGSTYADKCDCGALDTAGNPIPLAPIPSKEEGLREAATLMADIAAMNGAAAAREKDGTTTKFRLRLRERVFEEANKAILNLANSAPEAGGTK